MAAKKKRNVLVVDDVEISAFSSSSVFKDVGFEVEVASTAKEARAKLKKTRFNAVLVDKNLEGDDYGGSMELIAEVQRRFPRSHLAVVSAESGPGAATDVLFINKVSGHFGESLFELAERVMRRPWRRGPRKGVPLGRALERPIVIKLPDGRVRMFKFVEGSPFPPEAKKLIKQQRGTVLTLEQALAEPMVRGPMRRALIKHQQDLQELWRQAKKRKRGMPKPPGPRKPRRRRPR